MPNLISSLIVFVGRGRRLPVAPFSQSSQACAAPVARNSTAILDRSSFLCMDCPSVAKLCRFEPDHIAGHMSFIHVKVYFIAAIAEVRPIEVAGVWITLSHCGNNICWWKPDLRYDFARLFINAPETGFF